MKPNLNLSIGYLNIEGINDKIHGCKIKQLKDYLRCDIEILSETWGKCTHYDEVEGYNYIINEAQKEATINRGRCSGGMIVYYRKYLEKQIKIIKQTPNYYGLN